MSKPLYKLSYGTFWLWVDYKPSRFERFYCWSLGAAFALWPLWLVLMLFVLAI